MEKHPTTSQNMDEKKSAEKRRATDRRQRPTPFFSKYVFIGRRRKNRRATDPKFSYYVDRYGPRALAAMAVILALCAVDAYFTMYHLRRGATEVNPIMNFALSLGRWYFLMSKYALTLVGIFFLLPHKNFRIARIATIAMICMYAMLIAYHIYPLVFGY